MIKLALGFVAGFGLAMGLVYLNVLTPGTVRSVAQDPKQGVGQVADNVVKQVKEEAKNLRTNSEAAAMVTGKTGQEAACRREGLTTRHVCRTRDGAIYRVTGAEVLLFKGDLATLDPDLTQWATQTFDEVLGAAQAEPKAAAPAAP